MRKWSILLVLFGSVWGCAPAEEQAEESERSATQVYVNGKIYTVDSSMQVAEAFAVQHGKFVAVGTAEEVTGAYPGETIDLRGAAVYPGLIDAHCHFLGYGKSQMHVDLRGSGSIEEMVDRMKAHHEANPSAWIQGRGWDHTLWGGQFPTRELLDETFPDVPVFVRRVDGHAALINATAIELSGLTPDSSVDGGTIEVVDGKLTGILTDNAMEMVSRVISDPTPEEWTAALKKAEAECFAVGLTTVDDAGLDLREIQHITKLQNANELKMRIYAMVNPSDENFEHYISVGRIKTPRLHVRSFKVYADGALGSRGAMLKAPYSDKEEWQGSMVTEYDEIASHMLRINGMRFQMNTHCIGDSANRIILELNKRILPDEERRFRIEHCQVIDTADMKLFKHHGIIPSVQPTHATSDMRWAEERIGAERMVGAYAYKTLLDVAGLIVLGSDFPVEHINPLYGFYAAVSRKDQEGNPVDGFRPEEALSREEALKGMTIWAAFANFEEHEKGSIEPGKLADFVILDKDIMTCPEEDIFGVKVVETWLGGERVYSAN